MKYLTIPVEWFNLDLTNNEIFVLSEITNLSNYFGKCTANNRHFGEILQVKSQSISRSIKGLIEKGYIESEITDGSRNMERVITINKMFTPPKQNVNPPLTKCLETKGNNIIINNILSFLNGLVEKNFRATDKTKALIKSRLKEGFTEDDFKYVIKVKAKDWKGNEKMGMYLRPETLFGSKFEGYLNQEIKEDNDWSNYARK